MPTLKVTTVKEPRQWSGQNGSTFYDYQVIGDLDGQADMVTVTVKDQANAPKPGDTLEGTVEDGKYGKKFKKAQQGGWGGGHGGGGRTPEERESIEWQSARRDAIEFMRLKASLMKQEAAIEFVTTDNVVLITAKLAKAKTVSRQEREDDASPF